MSISEVANKRLLVKYVAPTKFDIAPIKTIWKYTNNQKVSEIYIQMNEDMLNPKWERMGTFLEKSLCEMIESKSFIDECFRLYSHHQDNPLDKISKILKDSNRT